MTQVKSVMVRRARMYRAIAGMGYSVGPASVRRRDLTPAEIIKLRHILLEYRNRRQVCPIKELVDAIGWDLKPKTLQEKLKDLGMNVSSRYVHRAHR